MLRIKLTDSPRTWILLALPLTWIVMVSLPEVLRDRIFPFDSAVIAANGALFQSLFADIRGFVSAPIDWLWDYYHQYPALSVRRHPPIFGFVAGITYAIGGISAMTAKFTVMLFAIAFAVGVFFTAKRIYADTILASVATLLVVASPTIAAHFRSVWLDIPALAFAIWTFYLYLGRIEGDRSTANVVAIVILATMAMYTYQLSIAVLAGVFFHLAMQEWRTMFRDRMLLLGAALLVVLLAPLAAFTLYFAIDNLQAVTGVIPSAWKEFDTPEYVQDLSRNRLGLAYWTEYIRLIAVSYPMQSAGLMLWAALRPWRKPTIAEGLMLVTFLVAYVGFSSLVVKVPRYTIYMMIPATFLSVTAFRDALALVVHRPEIRHIYLCAAIALAAIAQGLLVPVQMPYKFLSGMSEPVTTILSEAPDANILYSGRHDAAFVFYTRSLDRLKSVHIHRASVQLAVPRELAAYVDEKEIDYIVLETENTGSKPLDETLAFREAILAFAAARTDFDSVADFRLAYTNADAHDTVSLTLYRRTGPIHGPP